LKYLIDDVKAGSLVRALLGNLEYTQLVCAEEMTRQILECPHWDILDPEKTMLVFPGNGSGIVRSYLPRSWLDQWQWTSVLAKRIWAPGDTPRVEVGRVFSQRFLLGFKDLVVIDDVVSSGQTVRAIRKVNRPWIPGVRWRSVTWVQQRAANMRGFDSRFAVIEVGEEKSKVPVNSLSTLIDDPRIAQNYAQRNYTEPEKFLAILARLSQARS
jgi:hypoxanthine phosphoribosyltransferase